MRKTGFAVCVTLVVLLVTNTASAQEESGETDQTESAESETDQTDETGDADDGSDSEDGEEDDEESEEGDLDDGYGDTIAPSFDDPDEVPADEEYGDTIAPSFDDADEVPAADEYGDTIAPSFDDEDEYGDTIAPSFDDADEEYGDTIAPSFDDADEEYGDTIAPDVQEILPPVEDEGLADDEWDDRDDEWDGLEDEELDEEDDYYIQFWDDFDETDGVTEEAAPVEEMASDEGRVQGILIDHEFGQPVGDATVSVEETGHAVRTGVTGAFHFDLLEGFYILRIQAFGYETQVYEIEILPGETVDFGEMTLEADTDTVETIVVEGRANQNTEATAILRRRESAAVSDAVTAEEMSRSADGSANEAARRIVAATIVGGQFLFVRGLGGRYTRVTLNGVSIPSTDPDFPSVELDLFPSSLLSNMTIVKTFQPNLPGDWTGGMMQIVTKDYPEDFTLRVSLSTAFNSETTFQDRLQYHGGGTDFLGFDDGTRELPGEVPTDFRVERGRNGLTASDVETIGESFENNWTYDTVTSLPKLGFGVTVGDTVELGRRHMGYLATVTYSASAARETGTLRDVRLEGTGDDQRVTVAEELERDEGSEKFKLGVLANVSFEIADHQNLTLTSLFSQSARSRTRLVDGFSEAEGAPIDSWNMQWVQRSMLFNQLIGSHRQLWLDSDVTWVIYNSYAQREEPDTRDLTYLEAPTGFQFRAAPGSGERFFSELTQLDTGGSADWLMRFTEFHSLQLGGEGRISTREFDSRRFRFEYIGPSAEGRTNDPEDLFSEEGVGTLTEVVEITVPTDGYESEQRLYAGFLQTDLRLWDPVRLMTGVRFEQFEQDVESASPFALGTATADDQTSRSDTDFLPAAALIFTLNDDETSFIRLNYGATVARPQIREIAPFLFQDYVRRRTVQGNPDLVRTYVHNADFRFEYFFGGTELIAGSFFFKQFQDPIEQTIIGRNGDISYANAESATNLGGEFEVRVGLGRFTDALDPWSLGANLTLVNSSVSLTDEQRANATNAERALAGQSPFVVNVSLGFAPQDIGFESYLYYNVFGRRIEDVGQLGLPDVFREPFHSLELVMRYRFDDHWRLKFAASNLLFQDEVLTQGGIETEVLRPGADFSLGLSWSY